MSLSVAPLYEIMVRQFTTSGSSERFTNDFIVAVNNSLDDIHATGALDSVPTHITATASTSIALLSNQHSSALQKGIVYHLIRLGQKHSGMEYEVAKAEWEDAKGDIMVIERRDLQSDVDDDGVPTENIVGLGYLGDK